jgi:Putative capsular polysaccharide synthesis protein
VSAWRDALRRARQAMAMRSAERNVRLIWRRPAPIVIYQMGKVGSSAVHRSLAAAFPDRPLWHVHTLAPEHVAAMREVHERESGPYRLPRHWILEDALSRALTHARGAAPCGVVSLVRDPIARELSSLFQNPKRTRTSIQREDGAVDPERVLAYAREELARTGAFEYVDTWFDLEIKRVLGIDVFAQPFDVDRGFAVHAAGPLRLLVLRLEDLDRTFAPGVRELLGVAHDVPLIRAGQRSDLPDARSYRGVQERLRFPGEILDRIYAGRVSRHFYSEPERERLKARWRQT